MLVTCIFSFSHNVFYCVGERNYHFNNIYILCDLQMLSIWNILNFPYLVKSQSLYQVCPLITVDPCDQPTESWNRVKSWLKSKI